MHFQSSNTEMRNIETNEMLSIHQDGSITSPTSENKDTIIKQNIICKGKVQYF